eukprot:TRINITY_DN9607_c2_g2_i1.p1 TRINITY_DN9607_c2_g2~~TRINITY_DN9607_c2_g2_i1.p1  ORF type:complete len:465 (+),score=83.11 TRINITY_DN9607_c2_g2_i1:162-1397(+)
MICIRFVDKIGTGNKKFKRVMCITPTTLFLCHIVGEVRRFVKMSQIEGAIKSDVGGVPQLLIRCSPPEHDILVNFISDSRNDPKEKPGVFIDKLTKIKELRGEYFNIEHRVGSLFKMATLKKHDSYVAPKKRMDKAEWFMKNKPENRDEYEEEYDDNGYTAVENMGMRAGPMGGIDTRPPPPPPTQSMYRPVVVDDPYAAEAPSFRSSPANQSVRSQQPIQSYSQPQSQPQSQRSPFYNQPSPITPSYGSPSPAQSQSIRYGDGPPATFVQQSQPTVYKTGIMNTGPSFGGPAPSFTGRNGNGGASPPFGQSTGYARPPLSTGSGNSRGGGGDVRPSPGFSSFSSPRPQVTTIDMYKPPRQTEVEKWDQRRFATDSVNAPRPEDLGRVSALRSQGSPITKKSDTHNHYDDL